MYVSVWADLQDAEQVAPTVLGASKRFLTGGGGRISVPPNANSAHNVRGHDQEMRRHGGVHDPVRPPGSLDPDGRGG